MGTERTRGFEIGKENRDKLRNLKDLHIREKEDGFRKEWSIFHKWVVNNDRFIDREKGIIENRSRNINGIQGSYPQGNWAFDSYSRTIGGFGLDTQLGSPVMVRGKRIYETDGSVRIDREIRVVGITQS